MIKLEITAQEPFTFLAQQDAGNVELVFTRRDIFENNRKRELQRWSPALAVIEKAGLIKILKRSEDSPQSIGTKIDGDPELEIDRPSVVKRGRPTKSDKAE